MTPLRLGLLGAGFAARTIALAAAQAGSGQVVAVWSPTSSRREALAAEIGARPVLGPADATVDVDAVVVATPHQTHMTLAVLALTAGRHVYCEKPITTRVSDGEQLLDMAANRGLVLSVNHFQRFRRPNMAARRALMEGRIGTLIGGQSKLLEGPMGHSWQRDPDSVGFLLGYGVHAVDLLQWWLSSPVVEVSACVGIDRGVERAALATLRFRSGPVISLMTADRTPASASQQIGRAVFATTLVGERGLLDVDSYGATTLVSEEAVVLDVLPQWADSASPDRLEAYARAFNQFANSVRTGVATELSGSDALSAARVCLAAIESGRDGGRPVCV
jgi:predicted dehydrogenase